MGFSAFEVIFIPVLWGTLQGIVAGTAMLMLWNAVVALAGRLSRAVRSRAASPRAVRAAARRPQAGEWERGRRPVIHTSRTWGLYG